MLQPCSQISEGPAVFTAQKKEQETELKHRHLKTFCLDVLYVMSFSHILLANTNSEDEPNCGTWMYLNLLRGAVATPSESQAGREGLLAGRGQLAGNKNMIPTQLKP